MERHAGKQCVQTFEGRHRIYVIDRSDRRTQRMRGIKTFDSGWQPFGFLFGKPASAYCTIGAAEPDRCSGMRVPDRVEHGAERTATGSACASRSAGHYTFVDDEYMQTAVRSTQLRRDLWHAVARIKGVEVVRPAHESRDLRVVNFLYRCLKRCSQCRSDHACIIAPERCAKPCEWRATRATRRERAGCRGIRTDSIRVRHTRGERAKGLLPLLHVSRLSPKRYRCAGNARTR